MVNITVDQIIELYNYIQEKYHLPKGKPRIGQLESIVSRLDQDVYGHNPYPNIFLKCAGLIDVIIREHIFTDGNKRTGLLTAISYMEINGYWLFIPLDAISFAVQIAEGKRSLNEIAAWLERMSANNEKDYVIKVTDLGFYPLIGVLNMLIAGKEKDAELVIKDWIAYDAHKDEYGWEDKGEDTFKFIFTTYMDSMLKILERKGLKEMYLQVKKSRDELDKKWDNVFHKPI